MRFTAIKKTWLHHMFWSRSKENIPAYLHDDCAKDIDSQHSATEVHPVNKGHTVANIGILYSKLFGNDKFPKFVFVFFDILLCQHAFFLSEEQIGCFSYMLSVDLEGGFDSRRIACRILLFILSALSFPSSIVFALYERAKGRTYFRYYFLSLFLLLIPHTFLFCYIYQIILGGIGITLLKISFCSVSIVLFVFLFKGIYKRNTILVSRKVVYTSIMPRLFLIFLLSVYIYRCYDETDLNGYLRNEISIRKNSRTEEDNETGSRMISSIVLYSFQFPLAIFTEKIAKYGCVENYFRSMLFRHVADVSTFNSIIDQKKIQITDHLIGIYQRNLTLPMINFTSIHPYRIVLYLFKRDGMKYCIIDVCMPVYL